MAWHSWAYYTYRHLRDALERIDSQGEKKVILQPYEGVQFPGGTEAAKKYDGMRILLPGVNGKDVWFLGECVVHRVLGKWVSHRDHRMQTTIGRSFLLLRGLLPGAGGRAAPSGIIRCLTQFF